jgi:Lysozyme like domain
MKGAMKAALGLTLLPSGVLLIGLFGALLLVVLIGGAASTSITTNSLGMSLTANVTQESVNGPVSAVELAKLAHAAGIPNDQLVTAVAIALAESGGNPNAVDNDSNGTVDRGLWQINSSWASVLPGDEFNQDYNALSMAYISHEGTDWAPWTTYGNGSGPYLKHIAEAEQAVAQAGY